MTTAIVASAGARVFDALVRLGGTAQEVGESLRRLEVCGHRGLARTCPVATYLKGFVLGPVHVSAAEKSIFFEAPNGLTRIDTPPAVAIFIRRFDRGLHPDVELPRCMVADYQFVPPDYEVVDDELSEIGGAL